MPEGLKDAEKCIELDRAFSMGYSRKGAGVTMQWLYLICRWRSRHNIFFLLLGLFGGLLVRSRGSHIRWRRLLPGVTGR
ncbi:unnamed protein product [Brassica napus]|nr:unnamed protein product [Brassica napus]